MKIGFAKNDITPRVGVELCGFGPFCCRHSVGIRDRLWARAMAVSTGDNTVIVVSCDLVGITLAQTERIRRQVSAATGLRGDAVMVCCSHTHSGPATGPYIGWGAPDPPYCETLPQRIAKAAIDAFVKMREGTLAHAEVACEGVAYNREYDEIGDHDVLDDGWCPEKPELTDTTCHVLTGISDGRLVGFASYFGCHPVVCCTETRHIHGDYAGVATNMLEREHPGCVGLFLQGAQGDVNTCFVHKPEQESMLALDIIASRYAKAVRAGIDEASSVDVDRITSYSREISFSRKELTLAELRAMLAEKERVVHHPDATDDFCPDAVRVRMEIVCLIALRRLVSSAERGESLAPPTAVCGMRIGPIAILGSGFETFQAIKNDVTARAAGPVTLVTSFVNDSVGYAPDTTVAGRGGYAAETVPLIAGMLPYDRIHEELVDALLSVDVAISG